MLLIQRNKQKLNSVGHVNPRVRSIGLKLRLTILFTTLIIVSGCTEFAILMSGSSLAISQSTYAKMYNVVDFGTVLTTKKGIKYHVYEIGKKYIYDRAKKHVPTLTRFTND